MIVFALPLIGWPTILLQKAGSSDFTFGDHILIEGRASQGELILSRWDIGGGYALVPVRLNAIIDVILRADGVSCNDRVAVEV